MISLKLLIVLLFIANSSIPSSSCGCSGEWDPVCGSDGETYSNCGCFECAASAKPGLTIVGKGKCNEYCEEVKTYEPDYCDCSYALELLCGSDGKTYDNLCYLKCAQAKNPSLKLKHHGVCCNHCPKDGATPVCDNYGRQFSSDCFFRCQIENAALPGPVPVVKECDGPCPCKKSSARWPGMRRRRHRYGTR